MGSAHQSKLCERSNSDDFILSSTIHAKRAGPVDIFLTISGWRPQVLDNDAYRGELFAVIWNRLAFDLVAGGPEYRAMILRPEILRGRGP